MIGGLPGYMGPPPIDPTPIQPQGGNGGNTGGYPTSGGSNTGGTGGGNRGFNPSGGLNYVAPWTTPPMVSMPFPGGGPTFPRSGPGWMPPPPIGDPYGGGYRINPYDNRPIGNRGGRNTLPPGLTGINFIGQSGPISTTEQQRPVGWAPQRMPPPIPGWAGYLAWLQAMGGGRMPPPPIGGI